MTAIIHMNNDETKKIIIDVVNNITFNQELEEKDHTLNSGLAGQILLYATIGQYLNNANYVKKSISLLEENIKLLKNSIHPELFIGVTGTAWVIRHLINQDILDVAVNEDLEEVDVFLNNIIKKKEEYRYGLMYGWTGIGVYFLEKYYNGYKSAKVEIKKIVDILDELSFTEKEYVSWPDQGLFRSGKGEQLHNLGLAHGIPGVLAFLARIYKLDFCKPKIFKMVKGGVSWLLDRELNVDNLSLYPSIVSDVDVEDAHSRLSWCYGDLCVVKALLDAETVLKDGSCYENAIRILDHTLDRDIIRAKLTVGENSMDPTFCHGISGIAHLYNRIFQITRLPRIRAQSEYWLKMLIESSIVDKNGVIGFKGYRYINENEIVWENNNSLLHGSSGIGLVLSSYLELEKFDTWDNVFLTSNICYI